MDILREKTAKTSNYFSRYNGLYYYYNTLDGKYQLSLKSWLKHTNDYVVHTVQENDSWDYLSLKYYDSPLYYWIICDANKVIDPFIEPEKGINLIIPKLGKDLQFEVY